MNNFDLSEWRVAGYKEFPVPEHKYAQIALQKRFRNDDRKTMFFINAYVYEREWGFIVSATTQFYRGEDTVNLELHEAKSPDHARRFFMELWERMEMDLDHHNN